MMKLKAAPASPCGPSYSGNRSLRGFRLILSMNRSNLVNNRTIRDFSKYLEFGTVRKRRRASSICIYWTPLFPSRDFGSPELDESDTYRCIVLDQALVVATQRNNKHQTTDVVDQFNPVFTTITYSFNIENAVIELF